METITESKARTLYFTIHRGRFHSTYVGQTVEIQVGHQYGTDDTIDTSTDLFEVTDKLMVLNQKLTVTLEGHEPNICFWIESGNSESVSKPINLLEFLSKSSRATKYWIPLEHENDVSNLEFSFVESVDTDNKRKYFMLNGDGSVTTYTCDVNAEEGK